MLRVLDRVRRAIESRPARSLLIIVSIVAPLAVAACYVGVDMWRRDGMERVLEQTRLDLDLRLHDAVERTSVEFFKVRMLAVLLARDPRTVDALRFRDPARLRELDVYLAAFAQGLRLRRADVLDARAVRVASSEYDGQHSPARTDFRDAGYVADALRGAPGTAFGIGRSAVSPGFHFAVPVRFGDEIVGATAVKVDLETMAEHVGFSSAFATDDQGVVLLAADPAHLLRAVPGAPALALAPAELVRRYGRESLDVLPVRAASMAGAEAFVYGQGAASLRQTAPLSDEGLAVHAYEEIKGVDAINDGFLLRFLLAALGGGLSLTLLLAAWVCLVRDAFQRRELLKLNAELRRQAQHDVLTGCYNRRKFDDVLQAELKRAERAGRSVALVLLDLDRFKLVNDEHGHGVGDRMLTHVAGLLRRELRQADALARIGGEEFAIVLPETDELQAEFIVNRLRELVEAAPLPARDAVVIQTVSAGVAASSGGKDALDLLREADMALYAAKRSGRNRVVRASAADRTGHETDAEPGGRLLRNLD